MFWKISTLNVNTDKLCVKLIYCICILKQEFIYYISLVCQKSINLMNYYIVHSV